MLIHLASRGVRRTAAAGSSNNNPDNYAAATITYTALDYETEVPSQALSFAGVVTTTWGATTGYGPSGGWRVTRDGSGSEHNGGLIPVGCYQGSPAIPVDETRLIVVSWLQKVSAAAVASMLTGAGCKSTDFKMWNAGGTAEDNNTRQVTIFTRYPFDANRLMIYPVAGGGGGLGNASGYPEIAPLTNVDFADFADQWAWVCVVMDATGADADNSTRLYYKVAGDSTVTKFYHRTGDQNGGGGGVGVGEFGP